jgi:hypothetical protein
MAEPYIPLREKLRQKDPELAAELDLQWRIATGEWLPAIAATQDSSNTFPHIRNIENHMNTVLSSLHDFYPSAAILNLHPIEMYLLLASALFHDIGMVDDSPGEHGDKSRKYLLHAHDSLGIRNREVARSLGNICACHSKKPDKRQQAERDLKLWDIVIDPYGEVRQRMIAALLTLADHMDCAQTRVIPDYLREDKKVLGGFRNIIQGVFADPSARLVRTVLIAPDEPAKKGSSKADPKKKKKMEKESFFLSGKTWTWRKALRQMEESYGLKGFGLKKRLKKHFLGAREYLAVNRDAVENILKKKERKVVVKKIPAISGPSIFGFTEQLMAWNVLQIENPSRIWKQETLLAIILGDLRSNRESLRSIRDNLAAVGLPLATWLVDHEEKLFTPDLQETYEPRFHRDYLREVAVAMWELSCRVIGTSGFSYAELASHIGQHDVPRVRMAAKRLAVISAGSNRKAVKGKPGKGKGGGTNRDALPWSSPIWIGDQTWKWRVSARNPKSAQGCTFLHISDVLKSIRDLSDPEEQV